MKSPYLQLLTFVLTFSALQAATLQIQLVADDYNDTTGVWADSSGNGNNATRTGDPTLTATTPSGANAVSFDGSGDAFNLGVDLSVYNAVGGEGFVVVRKSLNSWDDTDSRGQSGIWDIGTDGAGIHYTWTDGRIYDSFGRNTRIASADIRTLHGGLDSTDWVIYNVRSSTAGWVSLINNQLIESDTAGSVSFNAAPTLGSGNGFNFEGGMAEFRFYSETLTTTERDAVFNSLNATYLTAPVPEPTTCGLLSLGLTSFLLRRRR